MKLKRIKTIALTMTAGLALWACNEKKEEAKTVEAAPKEKVNCIYNVKDVSVKWTAFKFTEKSGVGGGFDSLLVIAPEQSSNPVLSLKNASVVINAQSVNSNLPIRDEKLARAFFGPLAEQGSIKTMVKSIEPSGEGVMVLVFNGVEKELPFKAVYDSTLSLTSKMDLNEFNAQESMKALNKECEDLHKGADGKSVLWPDVELKAEFVLGEQCG